MTEKTIGQVLYAKFASSSRGMHPWGDLAPETRADFERQAQAVAAVVREQCAQECADYAAGARSIGAHVEAGVAEHLEEAIRSMK